MDMKRFRKVTTVVTMLGVITFSFVILVQAGTITKLTPTGAIPSKRDYSAIVPIGKNIYVFGGVFDSFAKQKITVYNDFYIYDTTTNSYRRIYPKGSTPAPRGFANVAAYPKKKSFIMYSGCYFPTSNNTAKAFFKKFNAYDDIWLYSAIKNQWTQLKPQNKGPIPRCAGYSWIKGDTFYVFAGVTDKSHHLNDLWSYNLKTNKWTQLKSDGSKNSPSPRSFVAASVIPPSNGNKILIYGGEGPDGNGHHMAVLNGLWEYDISNNKWTKINVKQNIFPPRNLGSYVMIGNNFYVQGGDMAGVGSSESCGAPYPQSVGDELWRYNINDNTWKRLGAGQEPLPRLKRNLAVAVNHKMYIMQGFDFVCLPVVNKPGKIWNTDVYVYDPKLIN